MKSFQGIIKVTGEKIKLDAGGVVVDLIGNVDNLKSFDGQLVVLQGEQEGAMIRVATESRQESSGPEDDIERAYVLNLIKSNLENLSKIPGVLGIRPGYSLKQPESDNLIILIITDGQKVQNVPANINGIPVEVRRADVREMTEGLVGLDEWVTQVSEGLMEAVPNTHYQPPPKSEVALKKFLIKNITCHVGPDSGWKNLKPFLNGTNDSLTVAMYQFYAPYIVDTVDKLGKGSDRKLELILDESKNPESPKDSLEKNWRDRFEFVVASTSGPNRLFNNSYHIKVAVRDSKAFWLSSGNWSPNSQPELDPESFQFLYRKGNREWHVIIEDEPMAQMYEKFIRYDMKEAAAVATQVEEAVQIKPDLMIPSFIQEVGSPQPKAFLEKKFATTQPVEVMPLLSPDNYASEILELIESAENSLYLQFAYINKPDDLLFGKIIKAIAKKMKEIDDVKVIVGGSFQKTDNSELLIGKYKWKKSKFRKQSSKVHNKGVIVDGKIAVVGSNNWSADGTQYNRDSSIIFYSSEIAAYYSEVFLFDWDNLTRPVISAPEMQPVLAPEVGPTPSGMVRIPWNDWFDL